MGDDILNATRRIYPPASALGGYQERLNLRYHLLLVPQKLLAGNLRQEGLVGDEIAGAPQGVAYARKPVPPCPPNLLIV